GIVVNVEPPFIESATSNDTTATLALHLMATGTPTNTRSPPFGDSTRALSVDRSLIVINDEEELEKPRTSVTASVTTCNPGPSIAACSAVRTGRAPIRLTS